MDVATPDHRAAVTPFRVFARVRPFIPEELEAMRNTGTGELELRSIIEMRERSTYLLDPKNDYQPKLQFEFDGSWWSIPAEMKVPVIFHDQEEHRNFVSQEDVYRTVGLSCVEDVVQGFNSCLMTYGQTGSGKTYTMMGNYEEANQRGVISRLCHDLFSKVAELRAAAMKAPASSFEGASRPTYTVEVNFIEVYMEKVRDLLDPSLGHHTDGSHSHHSLHHESKVRQHPVSGPYVEGVTKYTVETWAECCNLLDRGSRQRRTCANVVHNQSSRSHAIFQITLLQEVILPRKDRYSEPVVKRKAGRINLVDLAGSERGGATDYVKESAMINKSLLALRRVIDTLTARQTLIFEEANAELQGKEYVERPKPQVPFRDSILTWVLSDSIGGNAKTVMIATVSPYQSFYLDTLATLQWSHKARSLVTVVKANDVTSTSKVIKGMRANVEELNTMLSSQQQNVDNIRLELQRRQQVSEEMEKQNLNLLTRMDVARTKAVDMGKEKAVWTLQTALREHIMEMKLRLKRAALAGYRDKHAQMMRETEEVMAKTEASVNEVSLADQRKTLLQERMDGLQSRLETVARSEEEGRGETWSCPKGASLDEQRILAKKMEAAAQQAHSVSTTKIAAGVREREQAEAAIQQEIRQVKERVDFLRDDCAAQTEKKDRSMATLANEKSDLEAEINQLRKRVQLQDEMLPDLHSRLGGLKKDRDLLKAQCNELEAKISKKKKK